MKKISITESRQYKHRILIKAVNPADGSDLVKSICCNPYNANVIEYKNPDGLVVGAHFPSFEQKNIVDYLSKNGGWEEK